VVFGGCERALPLPREGEMSAMHYAHRVFRAGEVGPHATPRAPSLTLVTGEPGICHELYKMPAGVSPMYFTPSNPSRHDMLLVRKRAHAAAKPAKQRYPSGVATSPSERRLDGGGSESGRATRTTEPDTRTEAHPWWRRMFGA
jgi:hypothetical protein